jgi:hypothetical protein
MVNKLPSRRTFLKEQTVKAGHPRARFKSGDMNRARDRSAAFIEIAS